MKIKSTIFPVLLVGLLLTILSNCKKEDTTPPPLTIAVVTTTDLSAITTTTATSGGNISSDGGAAVTARGVCWSTSQNPTIADSKTSNGTGTGIFTGSITGLTPVTTYYFRAYATNSIGTTYGTQVTATTIANLPTLTTTAVSAITYMTATSGGNITNDGGAAVTARGVCWSTSQNPTTANSKTTDGTGIGSFTSSITALSDNKLYYLRAYVTNSAGTAYGSEMSFTTLQVTDVDGNVYHTVTIGTQVWLVENLKTTKYRNGNLISNVTDFIAWGSLTLGNGGTGAYCDYNNDANISTTYGRLYNWYAVNDSRNIAPIGWHVATNAEWTALTTYLGGLSNAGGKLKETGTTHWGSPNTGATNETGFTGLPGGFRAHSDGGVVGLGPLGFTAIGIEGTWWSSTGGSTEIAFYRFLRSDEGQVTNWSRPKLWGMSVRCVRDF